MQLTSSYLFLASIHGLCSCTPPFQKQMVFCAASSRVSVSHILLHKTEVLLAQVLSLWCEALAPSHCPRGQSALNTSSSQPIGLDFIFSPSSYFYLPSCVPRPACSGALPTRLQAALAATFPRVFLLTGVRRSNRGLGMRQHAVSTACLGPWAVCFPHCVAQERGNVGADNTKESAGEFHS